MNRTRWLGGRSPVRLILGVLVALVLVIAVSLITDPWERAPLPAPEVELVIDGITRPVYSAHNRHMDGSALAPVLSVFVAPELGRTVILEVAGSSEDSLSRCIDRPTRIDVRESTLLVNVAVHVGTLRIGWLRRILEGDPGCEGPGNTYLVRLDLQSELGTRRVINELGRNDVPVQVVELG